MSKKSAPVKESNSSEEEVTKPTKKETKTPKKEPKTPKKEEPKTADKRKRDSEESAKKSKKADSKKTPKKEEPEESPEEEEEEAPKKVDKKKADKKTKKSKKESDDEELPEAEENGENGEENGAEDAEEKGADEEEAPAKRQRTEDQPEVFVSNCPVDITEDDIKELFSESTVVSVKWLQRFGEFQGKGFVKFEDAESAEKALEKDGAEVKGQNISVTQPKARAPAAGDSSGEGEPTVFLGRVSDSVTENDVRELFKDCGEITNIRWGTKDGNFAGYGFVVFASPDALEKAVALSGTEMGGRSINVDVATPRSGGGGGGRGGARGGGFGGGGRGGRGGGFGGRGGRGGGGFGGRGGRGGGGFGGRGGRGGGRGGRGAKF